MNVRRENDRRAFPYAMARERVKDPKRLIHIGDNLKSDYAGAAALHLAAVHIPNDRQWFENNWNLIHKQMMDSKYEDAIWGTALHWLPIGMRQPEAG